MMIARTATLACVLAVAVAAEEPCSHIKLSGLANDEPQKEFMAVFALHSVDKDERPIYQTKLEICKMVKDKKSNAAQTQVRSSRSSQQH
jgi:hypothetical protein